VFLSQTCTSERPLAVQQRTYVTTLLFMLPWGFGSMPMVVDVCYVHTHTRDTRSSMPCLLVFCMCVCVCVCVCVCSCLSAVACIPPPGLWHPAVASGAHLAATASRNVCLGFNPVSTASMVINTALGGCRHVWIHVPASLPDLMVRVCPWYRSVHTVAPTVPSTRNTLHRESHVGACVGACGLSQPSSSARARVCVCVFGRCFVVLLFLFSLSQSICGALHFCTCLIWLALSGPARHRQNRFLISTGDVRDSESKTQDGGTERRRGSSAASAWLQAAGRDRTAANVAAASASSDVDAGAGAGAGAGASAPGGKQQGQPPYQVNTSARRNSDVSDSERSEGDLSTDTRTPSPTVPPMDAPRTSGRVATHMGPFADVVDTQTMSDASQLFAAHVTPRNRWVVGGWMALGMYAEW